MLHQYYRSNPRRNTRGYLNHNSETVLSVVLSTVYGLFCSLINYAWASWFPVECPICTEKTTAEELFSVECGHIACRDCAKRWYTIKIREENKCDLSCFLPNCRHQLTPFFVNIRLMELLDADTVHKLRVLLYNQSVSAIPEACRAKCPQPDCIGYFLKLDWNSYFVSCPACIATRGVDSPYCFKCQLPHSKETHYSLGHTLHRGVTKVLSLFMTVENESESVKQIRKAALPTHKCPWCSTPYAKDERCNHVTCPECGKEWNWATEQPWTGYW